MVPLPSFLTLDEVLAIHADQIERYGGGLGVRDIGLLQSAVAQPQASFDGHWLHPTLFDMAAAYLFHLVENHPFLDGNKRVGTVAALVFFELNDIEIDVVEDDLAVFVLNVAEGLMDKVAIADFFRARSTKPST